MQQPAQDHDHEDVELNNLDNTKEFVEIIEQRVRSDGINVYDNEDHINDTSSVIRDLQVCIRFFEEMPQNEEATDLKRRAEELIDRFNKRHRNATPSQETEVPDEWFGPASPYSSQDGGKSKKQKSRKVKKAKKSKKSRKTKSNKSRKLKRKYKRLHK
jgi:hypothetical protein